MSSASPSSASKSSVAGWVVAALGSSCRVSLTSNIRTGRPRRPSNQPHNRPTGPPPTINTRRSSNILGLLFIYGRGSDPTAFRYNTSDIDGSRKRASARHAPENPWGQKLQSPNVLAHNRRGTFTAETLCWTVKHYGRQQE